MPYKTPYGRGFIKGQTPDLIQLSMVSRAGLEPATTALKGRCSTIELPARWNWGKCANVQFIKPLRADIIGARGYT